MSKLKQNEIWYADDIPANKPKITRVAKKKLEKEGGFVWSDEFQFPAETSPAFKKEFHTKLELAVDKRYGAGTFQQLSQTESALMLCNMGKYGHAVFAKKAIPEHVAVAIYVGRYLPSAVVVENQDYLMEFSDRSAKVDAREVRNIAGFIQHAPSKDNPFWVFSEDPTKKMVTANLEHALFNIDGWEVKLFYSKVAISANSIVTYDYNINPWLHSGRIPACFTLEGKVYDKPIVEMSAKQYHPLIWAMNKIYFSLEQYGGWKSKEINNKEFLSMLSKLNHYAVMAGAFLSDELTKDQNDKLFSNDVMADPRKFKIMYSTYLYQSKASLELNIVHCIFLDAVMEFINHIADCKSEDLKCLRRTYGKGQNDYEVLTTYLKVNAHLSTAIIMMIRYAAITIKGGVAYKSVLMDQLYDINGAFMAFAQECFHPTSLALHQDKAAAYKAMPLLPSEKLQLSPNYQPHATNS